MSAIPKYAKLFSDLNGEKCIRPLEKKRLVKTWKWQEWKGMKCRPSETVLNYGYIQELRTLLICIAVNGC